MVHTDKEGQFPSACAHKKRRASVTRIVYVCIITIRVKNGRGTRAVAQGIVARGRGANFFIRSLSRAAAAEETKDRFRKPAENKTKKRV